MSATEPLVSIGLPVRNGEQDLPAVIESVLAQDYPHLELVICDNASTDGTEALCRKLAAADSRIVYHRHPVNVGLFNNFNSAARLARGEYFRWIGDDDTLAPDYVSRCMQVYRDDPRLVLVTTQINYVSSDGTSETAEYLGTALASDDPAERFAEMLRLLNESYATIDPLYGLMRRATLVGIERHNMYAEDQVLAARLALAGPWRHIPEILATRRRDPEKSSAVARKNGVPVWQIRAATLLQSRELLRHVAAAKLTEEQRRRVVAAVRRFYVRRQQAILARRVRRLARTAGRLVSTERSKA